MKRIISTLTAIGLLFAVVVSAETDDCTCDFEPLNVRFWTQSANSELRSPIITITGNGTYTERIPIDQTGSFRLSLSNAEWWESFPVPPTVSWHNTKITFDRITALSAGIEIKNTFGTQYLIRPVVFSDATLYLPDLFLKCDNENHLVNLPEIIGAFEITFTITDAPECECNSVVIIEPCTCPDPADCDCDIPDIGTDGNIITAEPPTTTGATTSATAAITATHPPIQFTAPPTTPVNCPNCTLPWRDCDCDIPDIATDGSIVTTTTRATTPPTTTTTIGTTMTTPPTTTVMPEPVAPTIECALDILMQLAGLPNTAPADSTIEDVLEILMYLAGLTGLPSRFSQINT